MYEEFNSHAHKLMHVHFVRGVWRMLQSMLEVPETGILSHEVCADYHFKFAETHYQEYKEFDLEWM